MLRVRPPAVLEVFTEDAFFGRVRSENDLVSQVCEFPFVNPQTGPFYIEGAEPGDTVAVHFVSITPARDWGASTTIPLFGALTGTHLTALLNEPLPELVWMWQLDRAAQHLPVHAPARRLHRRHADEPDARHGRGRAGEPGGPQRAGARRLRRQHGHAGDARRDHLLPRLTAGCTEPASKDKIAIAHPMHNAYPYDRDHELDEYEYKPLRRSFTLGEIVTDTHSISFQRVNGHRQSFHGQLVTRGGSGRYEQPE